MPKVTTIELDDDDLIGPEAENEEFIQATAYTIGYSIPDNEARIQFHNEFGVLSSFVGDAEAIYDFAQRLLRAYDKLEGL